MKILRKGDDFVKVADSNMTDLIKINSMIENGWNYSPKKDYKDAKGSKSATEVKAEVKKEQKAKEKTERKESKGKKEYKEKKESKKDNKKDNKKKGKK